MACTRMPPRLGLTALVLAAFLPAAAARAHEFWIEPADFTLGPDQDLVAALLIGPEFVGATFPYLPQRFERFDLISGDETFALPGRIGDDPALNVSDLPEGLAILAYVSTPSLVTYEDMAVYASFIAEKNLDWLPARNAERGLSVPGLTERFTRYAKSLVGVGNAAGEDRAVGLRTEIVAGLNPYRDDITGGMPMTVLLEGNPRREVPVEIFQRLPDGEVTYETTYTDDTGRVLLEPRPGAVVLVNSVAMLPIDPPEADGAAWHSLWASITFAIPEATGNTHR